MSYTEIMRNRIRKELNALKEFQKVPERAFEIIDELEADAVESMSTADAADMCISLAHI